MQWTYDPEKKGYVRGTTFVSRIETLDAFGVRFDTGNEVERMLREAYTDARGVAPSASELHAAYMAYMRDKHLLEWFWEAYAKRRSY